MIISQELDPTADDVVLALGERGVPVFRIDRAWFPGADRDGRHYFLESNPAGGQYGWLEAKTGVRLTAAVADLLAQDRSGLP